MDGEIFLQKRRFGGKKGKKGLKECSHGDGENDVCCWKSLSMVGLSVPTKRVSYYLCAEAPGNGDGAASEVQTRVKMG